VWIVIQIYLSIEIFSNISMLKVRQNHHEDFC
jgi:hypothetical protein